jgi:hypothetical protein
MKKVIRLTEKDLSRIVKSVMKEDDFEERQKTRERDNVVGTFVTQSMGKPYGYTLIVETESGKTFQTPVEIKS